ncbi:2287_t:CDS:2, partial [Racocetra persica]
AKESLESDIRDEKEHIKALEVEIQNITDQLQSERRDHQSKNEQLSRYEDELQAVQEQCNRFRDEMEQLQDNFAVERNQYKQQLQRMETSNKRRGGGSIENEEIKAQHAEDCKMLLHEVRYLKAKCYRESAFRADLCYQKKFLMVLLGGMESCEQATLLLISDLHNPTRRVISPLLNKFRSAVITVLAIQRMRILKNSWNRHKELKRNIQLQQQRY